MVILVGCLPGAAQTRPGVVKIRAGDVPSLPPYSFLTNGAAGGLRIELLRASAQAVGMEVEFVLATPAVLLEKLQARELDVIAGLPFSTDADRTVDFSDPHSYIPFDIVVARKSRHTEFVPDGGLSLILVDQLPIPREISFGSAPWKLLRVPDLEAALTQAGVDHDTGVVLPRVTAFQELRGTRGKLFRRLATTMGQSAICFAVLKGNEQLRFHLNVGLNIIRSNGTFENIRQKWLGSFLEAEKDLSRGPWRLYVAMVMAVLSLALLWVMTLRRTVERQTRHLLQANLELQEVANRFHLLCNSTSIIVAEMMSNGSFIYVNSNFHWAIDTEHLQQHALPEICHPEDLPGLNGAIHTVRGLPDSRPEITFRARTREGEWRWIEASFGSFRSPEGDLHLLMAARDVQERVKLEDQLRESQKMDAIGRLAGGIAHDFNNLLTGILGYANLLKHETQEGSSARDAAETIEGAAKRAGELTKQLLNFSRKGKALTVPVDIHGLIKEIAKLLGRTFDKNITLMHQLEANPSTVVGDPNQLQQIVLNLAVNAKDAMPEGGTLLFATRNHDFNDSRVRGIPGIAPGNYVVLKVTDTGMGISPEVMDRIFEPFFTTKEAGKGTGMGLALVYSITKGHGGSIQVSSEVGKGTTFSIFLPLTSRKASDSNKSSIALIPRGTGKVLLVDDEAMIRELGTALLKKLGYECQSFANPRDAVEFFRNHYTELSLVISDMVMPDLDGLECFKAMRAIDPQARVLLTSGFEPTEKVQEALALGALGFLPKPFKLKELGEAIADALRQKPERSEPPKTT